MNHRAYIKTRIWFKYVRVTRPIRPFSVLYNPQNVIDLSKKVPSSPIPGKRNILITSALPYVNNAPHIGNIVGCVLSADAYSRYCKIRGYNSIYICGTDEYGTATEFKAIEENVSCKELCDKYFRIHEAVYKWFQVDFDYFGRTSTENHTILTQEFFESIDKNGFFKYDSMDQLFCNKHNKFLADRFVGGTCPVCNFKDARGDQCDQCGTIIDPISLIDPVCRIDGTTPVVKKSDHIFLDLTKLLPKLKEWISKSSSDGSWSHNTKFITKDWLDKGLKPRCITRDLKWGVSVNKKGYESKVFYVWFDACIGYISITKDCMGENWKKWWLNPKEVKLYQFMGKDNVNFHTVIFPSMQLGTKKNWTMLHHIDTTEFLLYEDDKFSKSRGIGIFGDDLMEININPSVWRFYLLANRPEKSDVRFTWDSFASTNNKYLLSCIGNSINRVLKFISTNFGGRIPEYSLQNQSEVDFIAEMNQILKYYISNFESVNIRNAVRSCLESASLLNRYIQASNLSNNLFKNEPQKCQNVVSVSANAIYLMAAMLYPIIPAVSLKIYEQLNLPTRRAEDEWTCSDILPGHFIGKPEHLFKPINQEKIEHLRSKYSSSKSPHNGK